MKRCLLSVMSGAFLVTAGGYYVKVQDYDQSGFQPMA